MEEIIKSLYLISGKEEITMEDLGGIFDAVFQFSFSGFDWASLFGLLKSIPFLGFIKQIMAWASPKNRNM